MAIETIDNFNIFVGRNIDSRYGPYASVAEATGSINSIFRYKGLTVLITGSGQNIEYWFNPTTIDSHLVPKGAAVSLSGTDTQVVFFSGSTQISGSPNITYDYTTNHFFVTGSTTLSGSTFIPGISNSLQTNVVTINPATGQLFYTASNSLTGVSIPLDIKDDGNPVYSNPAVLNFTGSGVSASADGTTVNIYIPGGGVGTPGGDNTQIQFNGGGVFSGSSNFTFISSSNIVNLTGSMIVSGAISASFGPNTVGFFGTASWAQSASNALFAQTASFITASNVWGPFGSSSVFSASYASSSTFADTASFVTASNVWGPFGSSSVFSASYASSSTFASTASFITASNVWGPFGSSSVLSASYASGSTSASYSNTSSFSFTSSLAYTASFITASNVWGPFGSSSVASASFASSSISASYAKTASLAYTASFVTASNVWGPFGSSSVASASFASSSVSASYAKTASLAYTASFVTASNVWGPFGSSSIDSASFASSSISASYADTASAILVVNTNDTVPDGNESLHLVLAYTGSETGVKELQVDTGLRYRPLNDYLYIPPDGALIIGNTTFQSSEATFGSADAQNNVIYLTGSLNVSKSINVDGRVQISGSLNTTGSVYHLGLNTSTVDNVLTYNSSTGQVFYTASSAIGGGSGTLTPPATPLNSIQFNNNSTFGGSSNFTFISSSSEVYLTGSSITSGSTVVIGTSSIDGIAFIGTSSAYALYTTAKITTIDGTNTIYSLQTDSYDGAFFDYTLVSASNARAGQIMSIWSGSEIRYTETTTTDIGSTSEFIFSVALTAGSASLQVTGSTGAVIKTIIKSI